MARDERPQVAASGVITTAAGEGGPRFSGDRAPATSASLNTPHGVAATSGTLYIADTFDLRIRKVVSGSMTTVAGDGTANDAGPVAHRRLRHCVIRKALPGGVLTTAAGRGWAADDGDGGPAIPAAFKYPTGVAIDVAGTPYIADPGSNRVRKVSPYGTISTAAGTGRMSFAGGRRSCDVGRTGRAHRRGPRRRRLAHPCCVPADVGAKPHRCGRSGSMCRRCCARLPR